MTQLIDKTVLIVGLGMIGGSLASALRKHSPDLKLFAVDQNPESLQSAREQGIINGFGELPEMVPQADLIVMAVPPSTMVELIPDLSALAKSDAVITDVGSVKSHLISTVIEVGEEFASRFVPGHPIAGSEQSGFLAANDSLFNGRNTILTPLQDCSANAVNLVNTMWREVGANVLAMTPSRHDQVLAATSHLPHLLAYAIIDVLSNRGDSDDIFRYAAGGFADFSRVASSNARMWSDIFVENANATEEILDDYIAELQQLKLLIENKDRQQLFSLFSRAKQTRDDFIERGVTGVSQAVETSGRLTFEAKASGAISGRLRVPGDKSISHRSVIFGSLANGVSRVKGFLEGEDALRTVAAFREMGVTIVGPEDGELVIYGVGMHGLKAPRVPLNMGNSGTAMRLMAGLLSAQPFDSELFGDDSLNSRPMSRIADPLKAMGAKIETGSKGTPPLKIQGQKLSATHYEMPVASAQVKSCLLLAGLYASGETSVTEPAVCRDHTERMLRGFGYPLQGGYPEPTASVVGGQQLQAADIDIPADISSAAFFLVAASITPGSELLLEHVGINPTRIGIVNLLRLMGAEITFEKERDVGGEPVADLRVVHKPLQGITIPKDQVPLAIDEFPVLFVAAACAKGETVLRGAEELRVKESDRIEAMARGLQTLGIELETFDDGLRITGGEMQGGDIDSFGDHRIAMAFTVAALRAQGPVRIHNCQNVATSFPNFPQLAQMVGFDLTELDQ
ncbi:MAG: bifunctional prephenate dehydrogenase/3-phosphoshikimate 1-carboxyvinyltransferase [Gammaproteobacteria bacterium]